MWMETEDSASGPVEPESLAGKPPRPPLDARPRRGLGSWPVIVIGLVLTIVGFVLTSRTAPCADFHAGTQFSGSDARLAKWIGGCPNDLGEARATLLADGVLIAGYAIAAGGILRRWWPLYQAPGLKRRERLVVALPFIAAAIDVVENLATWSALSTNDTRFTYPDNLFEPTLVSTMAWLKMLVYGLGLLCVAAVCLLAIGRRKESATPIPRQDQPIKMRELQPPADLGVCCSGGGIRAAAFALGALDQLERAGVMGRARWLAAVSGGNYAATSWTLARVDDRSGHAAADVIDWLNSPIRYSKSPKHRFLRNGPGGLGRSLITALLYITFNVAVLAALVAAVAWPIGRLIGSKAIQPGFRVFGALPPYVELRRELWLPAAILLVLAGILLLVSALPSWETSWLWRPAAGLAAIGAAVGLLTVVFPWAMAFVGNWVRRGGHDFRAATTGLAALFGALGIVWRLARKPVLSRFAHKLPYLGGVLLAIAAVVWAGKVATDAATGVGLLSTSTRWAIVVAAFVGVYLFVGITDPSIHRIYRKRLRRSFGVRRDVEGRLHAPHQRDQITWDQLPESNPELVVCCAHQRDGIAPGGLPADTFTISRREVCIGGYVTPTESYLGRMPDDLASERAVASWMATSGAAFASAMGRFSRGTTNALMAALNIDLGIWLPNPRLTSTPAEFPKPRYGYLFKEILGWYDDSDRFVFVADGGHWDNLGLVELLRRRCATIICIDASGDDVGRFTSLHQAVELAGLELPEIVASFDLDGLSGLVGVDGALPQCSVTALRVQYTAPRRDSATGAAEPGPTGTIYYAKAQLASDLDVALRRYAKVDPTFPNYSTARLFLGDDQFKSLVALGRAAGARLTTMVGDVVTVAPAPESVTTTTTIVAAPVDVETTVETPADAPADDSRADAPTG
jgi:hypothetical protein